VHDEVKIFGFGQSHPCEAVYAAAKYKGIEIERVEIPPAIHRVIMLARFGGSRVPGAIINGRKVQGTTAIFHAFDELRPDPPLFPADPEERERVVEAEHWGEGEFQDIGRRLVWAHLSRSPETLRAWGEATEPGLERWMKIHLGVPISKVAKYGNGATNGAVREDLARLPELLDQVDALVEEGVIGGDAPNAADFQVLSTVGIWMNLAAIRPAIERRPCGPPAAKLFPNYYGSIPGGLLPDEWFTNLNSYVSSTS
jgi:glutathione S-transferase